MTKIIQVTYDTKADYDAEYSFWKRMYFPGTYEEVSKLFEERFPEMKAFSYDEVVIEVLYTWQGN